MAKIKAIQNGNWSDGSTWSSGAVPTLADDVYLNGKTVTMIANEFIVAKSISNYSDDEIEAIEGGYVSLTYISGAIGYISADIKAKDNIVTFQNQLVINGNIESYTTTAYTSSTRQKSTFYCSSTNSYNLFPIIEFNGNIITSEESQGIFATTAHNGLSSYTHYKVNGNITHNSGFLFNFLAYYNERQGVVNSTGINGNIYAKAQIFYNQPVGTSKSNRVTINGNVYQDDKFIYLHSTKITGNLIIDKSSAVRFCNTEVLGDTTINSDGTLYTYWLIGGGFDDSKFHNFYNNSTTKYLSDNSANVLTNNLENVFCDGEFHFGNNEYTTSAYVVTCLIPLKKLTAMSGCKLYVKNNRIPFYTYEIQDPSTFEYIYEGEGLPTFTIVPYAGNARLNYPAESDVKLNVEYGMQNEKKGQYSPTILTDEQLQRISNCATMAQVAELSTVIANKDN